MTATYADEGPNDEVIYELRRISNKAGKLFSMNKTTGEINIICPIDFEEETYYEKRVQAEDGLGQP